MLINCAADGIPGTLPGSLFAGCNPFQGRTGAPLLKFYLVTGNDALFDTSKQQKKSHSAVALSCIKQESSISSP
jgi:hypothetical protein